MNDESVSSGVNSGTERARSKSGDGRGTGTQSNQASPGPRSGPDAAAFKWLELLAESERGALEGPISRLIQVSARGWGLGDLAPKIDVGSVWTTWIGNWITSGLFDTRSRPADFKDEAPPSSYSARLITPGDYFAENEGVIDSMDGLNRAIQRLTDKAQAVPLVWRGQQNANWALHSSLFRELSKKNGVVPPEKKPTGVQPYPTEDDLVRAEAVILRVARESWRYEDLSAMEIFARLQHHGAPTRLLNVTRNPYIAAWFAVEASDDSDEQDARLFAMATAPVPRAGQESTVRDGLVGPLAALREPFWHALADRTERQRADWGTGANRRVWVPPEYDPRISAQNAAFVIDGVPMISSRTSGHFKTSDGHSWTKADLLAASSIYARMYATTRKPPANAARLAPTFSFRILSSAKPEIRQMLERWFGYNRATIYPDIGGLALHIKQAFNDIVDE